MKCYLSKSTYCRGKQCNKMLWLDKHKSEEATPISNQYILDNGQVVGELAKGIFGEFVNIERPKTKDANSIMVVKTLEELEKGTKVITEASFSYNNNFCSVDILKNFKDHFEIYEVKSSTHAKSIYEDDIAYQVYVLKNCGYNVTKACLVHLNSEYIRQGELELDKLFTIEDMTELAFSKQQEVEDEINKIIPIVEIDEEPNIDIDLQCNEHYGCQYWNYCTRNLSKPNVFNIASLRYDKKIKLYNKNKIKYEDINKTDINAKYYEQVEYELNDKGTKIDKKNIVKFMKQLSYPIYFLDFETYQESVPKYDGNWSYRQVPFQYSLHYIEQEGGELKHKEFLAEAGTDPRRLIAKKLVQDIPMNVCVTAYHSSFEKGRLQELANDFLDLKEHLLNIKNNIYDFEIPFKNRWYYNKEMQGKSSIKLVLPALYPNEMSLDYHSLETVHNGAEAASTFQMLESMSKEEQEKIRKDMLKYCELDTLAMVKVWEKLKEIIK